ncbi:MAG: carbamoyltransferase C-terminal domain-containing protein [Candidatus Aenigmatarchaeota archaeon]
MRVLGIWDGHDAGAAIVDGNRIIVAINEERLSRRKLDVGFPFRSIKACLDYAKLRPSDIGIVAASTSDFAKTLTRVFPSMKEKYYLLRRRKSEQKATRWKKGFKYRTTEWGSSFATAKISKLVLRRKLNKMDFQHYKLYIVDHHISHAAAAAMTAPFNKSAVVTLDGVGDGLSGSVNLFDTQNGLQRIKEISSHDSLGIFYEHVTNLLNMRELEDEGKVMAMSDFAYNVEENPMSDFFEINGLGIKAKYSVMEEYKKLKDILWHTPSEQFAAMAQSALENWLVKYFENVIAETGMNNIAWSGGIASNIKANRKIRILESLNDWFVFPHMGDGGLALGSAMYINNMLTGVNHYDLNNVYLGPQHSHDEMEAVLKKCALQYEERKDIDKIAAELINRGKIVFWFQGRMEYGPRALGNRSILASAFDESVKEKLNLVIKKRVWYQPFCPTLLEQDAKKLFGDYSGRPDRFMTMGYFVRPQYMNLVKSIINVDSSARPQILGNENPLYGKVLKRIRKQKGVGVTLNTSLNIHGQPMVCSPEDAVRTLLESKNKYMCMGNFFVINR